MRRLLVVVVLAFVACRREQAAPTLPPPRPEAPADDHHERGSLTNIARGATIISRSGEALLAKAASAVIDGDPETYWRNPPRDLPQWIVIGLPARSRIDRVGLRTARKAFTANHVQFETSTDGGAWKPLITVAAADSDTAQWFGVPPVDASFLRIIALDAKPPQADVWLHSVLARGEELEPPRVGEIDGCWTLNGRPAMFAQRGGRIIGAVAIGDQPLYLDGGSDGRVIRFVWMRGNDYGLALTTVSPDGKHLTALEWHEEAIPLFQGEPWFGERCERAEARPALREDVAVALLRRVGRYSVFAAGAEGVDHLAKLLASLRVPARIVVHEFREATAEKNKTRAQREIDSLRTALGERAAGVTFIAAGSDAPRQQPVTEPMRAMYSSVDLEIRR